MSDQASSGGMKAYQLALGYHPDRNRGSPDAEERFKEDELTRYLRLEKRAVYDCYGRQGLRSSRGSGAAGFDFSDAIDVFMRDFGGFSDSRYVWDVSTKPA